MTDTLVSIGWVHRAHGLGGAFLVKTEMDDTASFLDQTTVYIGRDDSSAEAVTVQSLKRVPQGIIIEVAEINDREEVIQRLKQSVFIPRDQFKPLPDGSYYLFQLEGLRVLTVDEQEVGILTTVWRTGANDVYVIETPDGKEVLIPAIKSVIKTIDVSGGEIIIDPLEGMLDQ